MIAVVLECYALAGLVVGAVGVVWVRLEGWSWGHALVSGYVGGALWPLMVVGWADLALERLAHWRAR